MLSLEVVRSKRFSQPLSILMADVDFFKFYNDTNGHVEGDTVLIEIAKIIKHEVRETDIAARFGGEEFSIILPNTQKSEAVVLAERLRKSVQEKQFKFEADQPDGDVTVSIGVASMPDDSLNADLLIRCADLALYQAKRNGRNRKLKKRLLNWFALNKRNMPWRGEKDPYKIWISEVMLQQTQVKTVIPYYEEFIKAFPNIELLANAKRDNLMKIWEGLGYYRRAKHLQETAKFILDSGESFPKTKQDLLKLKGIGDYTASMISSVAFGEKQVAIDESLAATAKTSRELELQSEKNIHEQDIVSVFIKRILRGFCSELNFSTQPNIRRLNGISHLITTFCGKLNGIANPVVIAEALQPTPAVCGDPRKKAYSLINKYENFSRGLYSGSIGWTSYCGKTVEIAVAIRSVLMFEKNKFHIYTGCGLVSNSIPEEEYNETSGLAVFSHWELEKQLGFLRSFSARQELQLENFIHQLLKPINHVFR
ncbi:hypothetical protein CHS0354_000596 [Potamilus streckersoni]|uniref:Adenine DNA glycosylase n=1 Tax=Potamilus streckersoni TaxID=2493646 RepID=A0AAE0T6W5_9BIVA|nr:hypothetical protein CHS0354_000596 [Potamilus streckersoni]